MGETYRIICQSSLINSINSFELHSNFWYLSKFESNLYGPLCYKKRLIFIYTRNRHPEKKKDNANFIIMYYAIKIVKTVIQKRVVVWLRPWKYWSGDSNFLRRLLEYNITALSLSLYRWSTLPVVTDYNLSVWTRQWQEKWRKLSFFSDSV